MRVLDLPFGKLEIPYPNETIEFEIRSDHNESDQSFTLEARRSVVVSALREKTGKSVRITIGIQGGEVFDPNGNHVFSFTMGEKLDREVWDHSRQKVRADVYTIKRTGCWSQICPCPSYPRAVYN